MASLAVAASSAIAPGVIAPGGRSVRRGFAPVCRQRRAKKAQTVCVAKRNQGTSAASSFPVGFPNTIPPVGLRHATRALSDFLLQGIFVWVEHRSYKACSQTH